MSGMLTRWQRRQGHLPWYRRYEFIVGFLALYLTYALLLMPERSALNPLHVLALVMTSLAYVAVLAVVQTDREKPLWLKNVTAMGLFVVLGWLFYQYSGARWEALAHYYFNFSVMEVGNNWGLMFQGLWLALKVFLYSLGYATLLALFLAVIRSIVDDAMLNVFIDTYVDVFRSIPPIALLLVMYSALPYSGIVLSPFATGVLTLTLIEAAYMSEVFRSGIEAIHKNQVHSARALGLSAWQAMKLVVLPQSVRIVLPDYANRVIGLLKRTAETSVIAIAEVLQTALQIQATYVNATPLVIGAAMYMVVLFPLVKAASYLERKRQRA